MDNITDKKTKENTSETQVSNQDRGKSGLGIDNLRSNLENLSQEGQEGVKFTLTAFWRILFVLVVFALAGSVLSKFIYEQFYQNYFFDDVKQLEFIISFTLASFFPISAIAYLLFQLDTQRRKLARGFWLLGIDVKGDLDQYDLKKINKNIQDRSNQKEFPGDVDNSNSDWDVEAYGEYFDRVDKRSQNSWNYIAQSIPPILATMLGISLFMNLETMWTELGIFGDGLKAMQFGFLGAYIFSLQLVYRRYTTFDLQPIVYMYCALTIIAGIVFNFVAFEAINALNGPENASGLTEGLLPIVAFSLGYFPYLAIRWFNRVGYSALGVQRRRASFLPLGLIDGISQFHETRLRDEGIDNVQNLASAELDELLINTRFSAPQVIAWVDQAILYLYLESNEIETFRRGGIRCFTDLQDYWAPYYEAYHTVGTPTRKLIETFRHPEKPFSELKGQDFQDFSTKLVDQWKNHYNPTTWNNNNLVEELKKDRQSLALQLKTIPDYLDRLYLATKSGPNVAYIKHYWKTVEDIVNTRQNKSPNPQKLSKEPELAGDNKKKIDEKESKLSNSDQNGESTTMKETRI